MVSFPIPGRSPKTTVRKQAVDEFIDYFHRRCIELFGFEPDKEEIRRWLEEQLRFSNISIIEEW